MYARQARSASLAASYLISTSNVSTRFHRIPGAPPEQWCGRRATYPACESRRRRGTSGGGTACPATSGPLPRRTGQCNAAGRCNPLPTEAGADGGYLWGRRRRAGRHRRVEGEHGDDHEDPRHQQPRIEEQGGEVLGVGQHGAPAHRPAAECRRPGSSGRSRRGSSRVRTRVSDTIIGQARGQDEVGLPRRKQPAAHHPRQARPAERSASTAPLRASESRE